MYELERQLIDILNKSNLPFEAKSYVLETIKVRIELACEQAKNKPIESEVKPDEQVSQSDNVG